MEDVVIWGEALFCIDASMDFCALYFTAKLLGRRTTARRLCLASLLCAAVGVFCTAAALSEAVSFGLLLLIWYPVWRIAVPAGGGRRFAAAGACLLFLFLEACSGGIMTAAFAFLNRRFSGLGLFLPAEMPRYRLFFLVAAGIFLVTGIICRMLSDADVRRLVQRGGVASVSCNGRKREIPCLFDSGNLVREPISGKPVMIVPGGECTALGFHAETLARGGVSGSRLIPMKTLSDTSLSWGIRPENVTLCADGVSIPCADVYIVFSDGTECAIVPTAVLQQKC